MRVKIILLLCVLAVMLAAPAAAMAAPSSTGEPGGYWYQVKRGDTLAAIARKYGVTVWSLAKNNGIKNVNRINVGQRLCIPWPGVPSGGHP